MARTFYDMLMLTPDADSDVITLVYRHLAKRYHPDANPGRDSEARMMALNEAYAILSDPGKRARYDEVIGVTDVDARAQARTAAETSIANDSEYGDAGVPPQTPPPDGSVLTFGRYRGWALNQIARYDRDYIEWLSRTTLGRNYRQELADLLRRS